MKSLLSALVLSISFCVPASAEVTEKNVRVTPEGIWYTVSRNETLSSISQKFTGAIRHWQSIGRINKIENDRTIPVGRIILVPASLLTPVSSFARISSLFGDVSIRDQNGNVIQPKVDMQLKEGVTLSTTGKSFISLALEDGSQIILPPDSTLNLRMLRLTQYVHSPRTRLFLERGRVESRVTPFTKPDSRYEVLSPLAVSGVRGTRFRVQYQGDRASNETLEGKVAVQAGNAGNKGMQLVAAGFGTIVDKQRTAHPTALLPAPALGDGYQKQEKLPLQFQFERDAAKHFLVRVSKDEQGMDNILEAEVAATDGKATARIADLPDGHYFVHVGAIDKHGLQGLPQTLPFEVAARPFAPFLMAPDHKFQGNATNELVTVPMQWSLSGGITSYRLQVAQDTSFSTPVVDQIVPAGEDGGRHQVALKADSYYWRVASIDSKDNRQGPFSDTRKLTIIQGLAAPATTFGDKDIHFSWSRTAPDQRFTFELSAQPDFATHLHQAETQQNEIVIARPHPGTYYARVRSIESDGFIGTFSPPQKFAVPMQWQTEYGVPVQSQGQPLGTGF